MCILDEASAKVYLEMEKTKAETAKIEAEKMENLENKAERAHVLEKKKLEHELQKMIKDQDVLDREEKRVQKALDKEAERQRKMTEIDKQHELDMMEKQWELENRDATAAASANTNAHAVSAAKRKKRKPVTGAKDLTVTRAMALHKKKTKPLTEQQKLDKSQKAKEQRKHAALYKQSLASNLKKNSRVFPPLLEFPHSTEVKSNQIRHDRHGRRHDRRDTARGRPAEAAHGRPQRARHDGSWSSRVLGD